MDLNLYHKTQSVVFSELVVLSTSYFRHIIPHRFCMRGCNLVYCNKQGIYATYTRFDTPWGSKPPHLPVGVFESLRNWSERRGACRYLFVLFVDFYLVRYGDAAVRRCEVNVHFFALINLANCVQFNVWGNYWCESSRKCR